MINFNTLQIRNFILLLIAGGLLVSMSSCEQITDPSPTNELMQGVWSIESAYDEEGNDITEKVTTLLPAYIHLDDKNSVNSTCGPLFMYIVYGNSKFINVVSRIDEVFDYADLSLTEGEWFIKKAGQTDKFTCEIKMKFPGMNTLESILSDMGGINLGFIENMIEAVIYHKFVNIEVEINELAPNQMTWRIEDNTTPIYNTKDEYGNYISWTGVSLDSYSRCTIHWRKEVKTITQLVQDAYDNNKEK